MIFVKLELHPIDRYVAFLFCLLLIKFSFYKVSATRKPILCPRWSGVSLYLSATRQASGLPSQPPPLITFFLPVSTPIGLRSILLLYSPFQSLHHSHTLPVISYKPKSFAA